MTWETARQFWPNAGASRFIDAPPHRWHVQIAGDGPDLLLLHGAGSATHSWRAVFGPLSERYRVIAPDLPGHGFTQRGDRSRSGMQAMAEDLARLAKQEGWTPRAIIGHSAGGALALSLTRLLETESVIGLNAALNGFEGIAGWLFPALARTLARNPLMPDLAAALARRGRNVDRVLATTGSNLDPEGRALYAYLARNRRHVDGTLSMMAQWDAATLTERLPSIRVRTVLIAAEDDGTVSARTSEAAAARIPGAIWHGLPKGGHLVHETDPGTILPLLLHYLDAPSPRRSSPA